MVQLLLLLLLLLLSAAVPSDSLGMTYTDKFRFAAIRIRMMIISVPV